MYLCLIYFEDGVCGLRHRVVGIEGEHVDERENVGILIEVIFSRQSQALP